MSPSYACGIAPTSAFDHAGCVLFNCVILGERVGVSVADANAFLQELRRQPPEP